MKQHISVLFTILLLIIFSCTDKNSFNLCDLEGEWNSSGESFSESWQCINSKHLLGKGFEISGADTIIFEALEIKNMDGTLSYLADVIGENNDETIVFPVYTQNNSSIEFVNEEHDFPQAIRYEKKGTDSLKVIIGKYPLDSNSKKMVFNFVRVK